MIGLSVIALDSSSLKYLHAASIRFLFASNFLLSLWDVFYGAVIEFSVQIFQAW